MFGRIQAWFAGLTPAQRRQVRVGAICVGVVIAFIMLSILRGIVGGRSSDRPNQTAGQQSATTAPQPQQEAPAKMTPADQTVPGSGYAPAGTQIVPSCYVWYPPRSGAPGYFGPPPIQAAPGYTPAVPATALSPEAQQLAAIMSEAQARAYQARVEIRDAANVGETRRAETARAKAVEFDSIAVSARQVARDAAERRIDVSQQVQIDNVRGQIAALQAKLDRVVISPTAKPALNGDFLKRIPTWGWVVLAVVVGGILLALATRRRNGDDSAPRRPADEVIVEDGGTRIRVPGGPVGLRNPNFAPTKGPDLDKMVERDYSIYRYNSGGEEVFQASPRSIPVSRFVTREADRMSDRESERRRPEVAPV